MVAELNHLNDLESPRLSRQSRRRMKDAICSHCPGPQEAPAASSSLSRLGV